MDSYSCTECINVQNLKRILSNHKIDEQTRSKLEKLKKRTTKNKGCHRVEFICKDHLHKTKGVGRLYPKYNTQSLQDVPRDVRKALVYDQCTDVDITNCHPVLLLQLFKQEGIVCDTLEEYVTNRESRLQETGLSRDDAKDAFIRLLYGGKPSSTDTEFMKRFHQEFVCCSVQLLSKDAFVPYKRIGELKRPTNALGSAMSYLCQDEERRCVGSAISAMQQQGYECSTLIHDGFLVKNINLPEIALDLMKQAVKELTGYDVTFEIKSLSDFDEDKLWDESTPMECDDAGDTTSARLFLGWLNDNNHHFVRCGKQVFWYNPSDGIWSQDLTDLRSYINDCPVIGEDYRESSKKKDCLLKEMVIPRNEQFLVQCFDTTYQKIAFQNGVWDFAQQELLEFSSEYGFFSKSTVPLDFEHGSLCAEVYQKLFVDVFGDIKGEYMIRCLSRAMAGEVYDKVLYAIVGDPNSGKGTMTDILMATFGAFVGNINASVFCSKPNSGGDEAKARSWMCPIRNCRIILSNEIPMNRPLDASMIKTISSGGDPITARQNHQDEYTFKCQASCLLFVNDMPEIRGMDDATTNRMRYITTEYSYLDGDNYERHKNSAVVRKADVTLKSVYIKRDDVMKAFAYLLCTSYQPSKPHTPEEVITESRQWTEADDMVEHISSMISSTGDVNDYLPITTMTAMCKQQHIDVSQCRLGRIMRGLGHPSKVKTINRKSVRVFEGVTLDAPDHHPEL